MYTIPAFPTKKALEEAILRKETITVCTIRNGHDILLGSNWHARVKIIDGRVVEVLA